jgi:hypothetical protein
MRCCFTASRLFDCPIASSSLSSQSPVDVWALPVTKNVVKKRKNNKYLITRITCKAGKNKLTINRKDIGEKHQI